MDVPKRHKLVSCKSECALSVICDLCYKLQMSCFCLVVIVIIVIIVIIIIIIIIINLLAK